ncbi:hypothetical protein K502DRAFT_347890 [Neoconidiobolus thromboides FSU 785]|nr:hypothetical protein K502DRAFT_347890 [Neoconidiobolus thromboides FSU 785]
MSTSTSEQIPLPKLHNGNCQLINDTIYYLGGSEYDNNNEVKELNSAIYKLRLNQNLQLMEGIRWEKIKPEGRAIVSNLGRTIVMNNNQEIWLIGGNGGKNGEIIRVYDIEKNEWNLNKKQNAQLSSIFKKETSLLDTNLIKDSSNNYLYLFGGYLGINNALKPNLSLVKYSIKQKEWSKTPFDFPTTLNSEYKYHNSNRLFTVGGNDLNMKAIKMNYLSFIQLDLNQSKLQLTDGELPPAYLSNHSFIIIEDYLYLIGGNNTRMKDNLYQLDLKTYLWKKISISGLLPFNHGCLIEYNNHLFYLLGKDNNNKINQNIQIISLNQTKLITNYTVESTMLNTNTANSLPLILGIVIPIILLLLLVIILYYYYNNKKEKFNKLGTIEKTIPQNFT